jgi:hypothetical protein
MYKEPIPIKPAKPAVRLTGYEMRLLREKRINAFFKYLFSLLFVGVAAAVIGRVFPTSYEVAILLGLVTGILAGMSVFNLLKYLNHE